MTVRQRLINDGMLDKMDEADRVALELPCEFCGDAMADHDIEMKRADNNIVAMAHSIAVLKVTRFWVAGIGDEKLLEKYDAILKVGEELLKVLVAGQVK